MSLPRISPRMVVSSRCSAAMPTPSGMKAHRAPALRSSKLPLSAPQTGPGRLFRFAAMACCLTLLALPRAASLRAAELDPAQITTALQRSADWQLANPSGTEIRDWIIAPLYDGLIRSSLATGDPKYLAAVLRLGMQAGWTPSNRIYHADDQAVGHAWLDIHLMDPRRGERLRPMRERLSQVIAHPVTEALAHGRRPRTRGVSVSDRWTWCDALYMAPPTLARLFTATGERKFLDFLDAEFQFTYEHLYDPAEKLFFRDATFFDKKTPNGRKVFWSRGNGWVYGGLALTLEHLPQDHPKRGFYENLFREMSSAILAAQQPDGLWRPSLLDPEEIPVGETSGSGFFTFGLAWGLRHGLLDRAAHFPAITRAWQGLMTRIGPDGSVGHVQPVGAAPGPLEAEMTQDYGTGAFLLAGAEILGMLGVPPADGPALLRAAEALVEADTSPRAWARLVPERKDDLAWENDKIAFRIYGPALRESIEDSGIDAWTKRVARPVIASWYHQELTLGRSYHQDHGEGLDAYKVGDTLGCGGLGLWVDGKLLTANTYLAPEILWTGPDRAEFHTVYRHSVRVGGKPLYEYRSTRLRLGERFCEITAVFSDRPNQRFRHAKQGVAIPFEVAIGLTSQDPRDRITLDAARGIAAIYGPFAGNRLGSGIRVDPARVLRAVELPARAADSPGPQALLIVKPDEDGRISYRSGFAWGADGEITSEQAWLDALRAVLP